MATSILIDYQTLLHRMVYRKLQWLEYYGEGDVQPASDACHAFADLVVQTSAPNTDAYLVQLHDATLSACIARRTDAATATHGYAETLGTLFNNSREIYIASFHTDPIRSLPGEHPRFPWEHSVDAPQDPDAIDVTTLTEPLPPPTASTLASASDQSFTASPWLIPMSISAAFSIALLFILIGLGRV